MPPKVTVRHEATTPSQQVVKAASQIIHVTDSTGRKLGLRQLPFLEEFRIMEALGPELSANAAYMGTLAVLLHLAEIDGDPVEIPRNKLQVEGLIQRADRAGFNAIAEAIPKYFAPNAKALENKIKNGEGTQVSETVSGS